MPKRKALTQTPDAEERVDSSQPQTQLSIACSDCHRRKVKCDRKLPCSNCTRAGNQCVPQSVAPRKRRFPERELLARLRKYEDMMRSSGVKFDPLHYERDEARSEHHSDDEAESQSARKNSRTSTPAAANSEKGTTNDLGTLYRSVEKGQSRFDADNDPARRLFREQIRDAVSSTVWQNSTRTHEGLLFSNANRDAVDLTSFHPEPVHIFRLWHIYLENVNPLLKLTHTPTLQGRIVEAASNVSNVKPEMEALMFGIYCVALLSLTDEECSEIFNRSKKEFMEKAQFGCQQALLNANFLGTRDYHCLAAYYLYLTSIRMGSDPVCMSSLVAIAIRIARRLGMHSEASKARFSPLDAEMHRRLWWALVLFDTRVGETAQSVPDSLSPVWDCSLPSNVSDSDLSPEMQEAPASRSLPTEALFVVMRSMLGDCIRNAPFYLDMADPALKALAKQSPQYRDGEAALDTVEREIESQILRHSNEKNNLHLMTIWTAKSLLAKYRFGQLWFKLLGKEGPQTDAQSDEANRYAVQFLECDTTILKAPSLKGFTWMTQMYFPFPGYIQLLQDLKKRPFTAHSDAAWAALGKNFDARRVFGFHEDTPVFRLLAGMIFGAWDSRIAALRRDGRGPTEVPDIVTHVRNRLTEFSQEAAAEGDAQVSGPKDLGTAETQDMSQDQFNMDLFAFPGNTYPMPPAPSGELPGAAMSYPGSMMPGFGGMDVNHLGGWVPANWSFGGFPNGIDRVRMMHAVRNSMGMTTM